MDHKAQDFIPRVQVQATADNLNAVMEVQEKWKAVQKSEQKVIKTKDRTLGLQTHQQLQDFLNRLDDIKEVNSAVRSSRKSLVQEISHFKDNMDGIMLRNNSLREESEEDDTKPNIQKIAANLNVVIEVQKQWKIIQKSEMDILKTRDRTWILNIHQQLQDLLSQLENIKDVNSIVQESRRKLVQEITHLKKNIEDLVLPRTNSTGDITSKCQMQNSNGRSDDLAEEQNNGRKGIGSGLSDVFARILFCGSRPNLDGDDT